MSSEDKTTPKAEETKAEESTSPAAEEKKDDKSATSRGRAKSTSTSKSTTRPRSSSRSRSKSTSNASSSVKKSTRVSDAELAKNTSAKTAEKSVGRVSDSVKRSKSTSSVKASTKKTTDKSEGSVRKSKSFKGIRGLLRGKSKRKSQAELSESKRAELAAGAGGGADDQSTVYNVTLDDRSTAASTAATDSTSGLPKTPDYLLRMVILLMDVKTRRFELLQLEFDSEKAMVSDVLSQVPVSVTEEALRSQEYQGVVTASGEEMKPDKKLSEFCSGNDVLVAVPKDLSSKEVARLSKPILSDPKVIGMLKSSGVDAKDWGKATKTEDSEDAAESEEGEWKSRQIPDYGKADGKPLGGTIVFAAIGCAVVAVILNFLHVYISTPIQPGHVVSPGIVLSKCGLLKGWPIVGPACNRTYLEVNSGSVSYYEGKELAWVIHGHSCEPEEVKAKTCIDGLEFRTDGSLALGGQPISWLERHSEAGQDNQLSPWPFAEQPKIKSWNIATNKISHGAKEAVDKIKEGAADTASKIKEGTASAAAKVKEGTAHTASAIKDGAVKVKDVSVDTAGKLKNATVDTAGKLKNATASVASGAAGKIKLAADKIKETPLFMKANKATA